MLLEGPSEYPAFYAKRVGPSSTLSGRACGIGSRDCLPPSGEKPPISLTLVVGGLDMFESAKGMGIVGFRVWT